MIKKALKLPIESFQFTDIVALLVGTIVPLAFAPFQYYFLVIIAAATLFYIWANVSPKRALWQGWLFGLGYFGVGVSWIYISIHDYGQTPAILAFLLTAFFISGLALFFALLGYGFKRYSSLHISSSIIGFASLWAILEYCRSYLFTGFPWLLIGDSQIHSPLKGFMPIVGVYGTTFFTILCAALIATVFLHKKLIRQICSITFLAIVFLGFMLSQHAWTQSDGNNLNVSLIQGNIDQNDKWQPQFFNAIIQTYHNLTMNNLEQDLIVWPETAVPMTADMLTPYLNQLNNIAKQNNTAIMLGIPIDAEHSDRYYNALLTLGNGQGHYYKNHLVPFGEYIPFGKIMRPLLNILNIPQGDYISGEKFQPSLLVKDIKIAAYICYEIAYSQLVYQTALPAQVLLTISDDSWFGNSLAAPQHLQIAQARALETGRPMLFATNNGLSAVINAQGQIIKQAPPFTTLSLRATVSGFTGVTPIMSYGNIPILLILLVLLLFSCCKKTKVTRRALCQTIH